jgi:hypothetical protein
MIYPQSRYSRYKENRVDPDLLLSSDEDKKAGGAHGPEDKVVSCPETDQAIDDELKRGTDGKRTTWESRQHLDITVTTEQELELLRSR